MEFPDDRRNVVPGPVQLRLPPHRNVHHSVRTQQGEISFCAYNTGIGWRKIIENMYKNATVAQWYKEHGKHDIYAKGRAVNLNTYEHSLVIDAEDAARVRNVDHDVPITAAEETVRAAAPSSLRKKPAFARSTRNWC